MKYRGLSKFKTPREIKIEKQLEIAQEALFMISHVSYSGRGKEVEGYYRGIVHEALQKMKEVKND